MIKTVSYHRLLDFERCKLACRMKHIDHIPEEQNQYASRGTAIHQMAEDFVRGKGKAVPSELLKFASEFIALRREFKAGHVVLESEWGFDREWLPHEYKHAWLRMKADCIFLRGKTEAVVIDYKTGQKYGNEIKHGEQILLYAIATLIMYPNVERVTVELWYVDKDELTPVTYTRMQALRYVQMFDKRLKKVTSCTKFPANPNIFTCKYCAYGPSKGGQCAFGVSATASSGIVHKQYNLSEYRSKFG